MPLDRFLDDSEVERWRVKVAELLQTGSFEVESRWVKSSGEQLDVWISGRAVGGPKGQASQTRCVAQDRTAKHRLEAELRHEPVAGTSEHRALAKEPRARRVRLRGLT